MALPPQPTVPAVAMVGDTVALYLLPSFPMTVEAFEPCTGKSAHFPCPASPHSSYLIADRPGHREFLCGYDMIVLARSS